MGTEHLPAPPSTFSRSCAGSVYKDLFLQSPLLEGKKRKSKWHCLGGEY